MVGFGRSDGSRRSRSTGPQPRANVNPFSRSRPTSQVESIQSTPEPGDTTCRKCVVETRSGIEAAQVTGSVDGLYLPRRHAHAAERSRWSAKASLVLGLEGLEGEHRKRSRTSSPELEPRRWAFKRPSLKRSSSRVSLTPSLQASEEPKTPTSNSPSRRGSNDKLKDYCKQQKHGSQISSDLQVRYLAVNIFPARDSPSISHPTNFQHLTHTKPHQFTNMSSTNKDLVAEFSAHRAGQPAETGLRGIKVENISSRSSIDTRISPLASASSEDSLRSSSATSPGSIDQNFRILLKTKASFSQPFKEGEQLPGNYFSSRDSIGAPPPPPPTEPERDGTEPQADQDAGAGKAASCGVMGAGQGSEELGRAQPTEPSTAQREEMWDPDWKMPSPTRGDGAAGPVPPTASRSTCAPAPSTLPNVATATAAAPAVASTSARSSRQAATFALAASPSAAQAQPTVQALAVSTSVLDNPSPGLLQSLPSDGRGRPVPMASHHALETILPSVSEEGLATFSDCARMVDLSPVCENNDPSPHGPHQGTFLSSPSQDSPDSSRSTTPPPFAPRRTQRKRKSFKVGVKGKGLAPPAGIEDFRVSMNRSSMIGGLFSSWAADSDSSSDDEFRSNIPAEDRAIPSVTEEAEEDEAAEVSQPVRPVPEPAKASYRIALDIPTLEQPEKFESRSSDMPSPRIFDASVPRPNEVIPRALMEPKTGIPGRAPRQASETKPRMDSAIAIDDQDTLPEQPPPVPSKLYIPSPASSSFPIDRAESPRSALRNPQNSGRLRRGSKNSSKSVRFQEQDLSSENRTRRRSPNKPDYSEIRANLENLQRSLSKLELQASKPSSNAEAVPNPPPPPSASSHTPGFGHKRRKTAEAPDGPMSFEAPEQNSDKTSHTAAPRPRSSSASGHDRPPTATGLFSPSTPQLPPPTPPKPQQTFISMI